MSTTVIFQTSQNSYQCSKAFNLSSINEFSKSRYISGTRKRRLERTAATSEKVTTIKEKALAAEKWEETKEFIRPYIMGATAAVVGAAVYCYCKLTSQS